MDEKHSSKVKFQGFLAYVGVATAMEQLWDSRTESLLVKGGCRPGAQPKSLGGSGLLVHEMRPALELIKHL